MGNTSAIPTQIAGVWRRLFAFLLDLVVLGIFGAFLGVFLYDFLASIGGWGRLIGFPIALTYFGIMNSRIHSGQTLGKMAMKIKVISSNGDPLSILASLSRSSILCVPYFLNGAQFDVEIINSWFANLLGVLVFGVGFAIVYLFIFNRKTRQSLHDLAVASYVVNTTVETTPLNVEAPWRGHYVVVVILMAAALAAPIVTEQFVKKEPFASLLTIQKGLESQPGIRYVSVMAGSSSFFNSQNGAHSTSNLSIHVVTDSKDMDREDLANQTAQFALNNYAEASKKDKVIVSISYGYDIGIASAWRTQNFSYSPTQWSERLAPKLKSNFQQNGKRNSSVTEIKL